MRRVAMIAACAASAVALAHEPAPGKPVDPAKASRTIAIDMSDTMRFTPAAVEVKRGESIRFLVRNSGKLVHEFVLGSMADLREHAQMMKKHPDMHHDEPNMVQVPPGQAREVGWRFTSAGEVHFGCLVPGHFDAGMIGKVTVK